MEQQLFVGKQSSKLDEKGRLVFPSVLKSSLASLPQKELIVRKDFYQDFLILYTVEEWKKFTNDVRERLDLFDEEQMEFWNRIMSERAMVTPDEKAGRILIPREMLDEIGVDKEVVFVGADELVQLWAKETYEKNRVSKDKNKEDAGRFLKGKKI